MTAPTSGRATGSSGTRGTGSQQHLFNSLGALAFLSQVSSSTTLSASVAIKWGSIAPFFKLLPDGSMKAQSYIRLLAFLAGGNVLPRDPIG